MQQVTAKYCFAFSMFMLVMAAVAAVQMKWGFWSLPMLAGMAALAISTRAHFALSTDLDGKPFSDTIVNLGTFVVPLAFAFWFWVLPSVFSILMLTAGLIGGILTLFVSVILLFTGPVPAAPRS